MSKTINFDKDATQEDVREAYILAHELGCKGLTIYRDGSREGQVLNKGKIKKEENIENEEVVKKDNIRPRQRPGITSGMTEKVKIGCGNLYVTVNYDEKGVCEIFTNLGRAGGMP